jgi:transcriptional regulator with XRE-family HTH domain
VDAPTPEKLRLRLAGWARYGFVKMRAQSVNDMAKRMGFSQTGLNRIIAGTAQPGIDFAAKLASFAQESLDRLVFHDPPEQFLEPGIPPPGTMLEQRPRRAR